MAVLVVDDDVSSRKVVVTMLGYYGIPSDEAESGSVCLHMLLRRDYDLVISDLYMPDLDGVELGRQIRQMYPGLEIYAYSGITGTPLVDEAASVFSKVYRKPAEVTRLIADSVAHVNGEKGR